VVCGLQTTMGLAQNAKNVNSKEAKANLSKICQ